jgi:hypothetical protein
VKRSTLVSLKVSAAPMVLGMALISHTAFAQAADSAPQPATNSEEQSNNIVVTGSRIARPNLESTVPIASIAGEQFFKQGDANIGEALNELPQLRSTFS